MGLLKGNKSDHIIFRILNSFGFIIVIIIFFLVLVYLYYLGLIVSGHHISPYKGSIRVYFSLESL